MLTVGNHTVSFNTLNGWVTSTNLSVTINSNQTATVTGTYALSGPTLNLTRGAGVVTPLFNGLGVGTTYQLQLSSDLVSWTNMATVFTATNASQIYPQYFDMGGGGRLFFRLRSSADF